MSSDLIFLVTREAIDRAASICDAHLCLYWFAENDTYASLNWSSGRLSANRADFVCDESLMTHLIRSALEASKPVAVNFGVDFETPQPWHAVVHAPLTEDTSGVSNHEDAVEGDTIETDGDSQGHETVEPKAMVWVVSKAPSPSKTPVVIMAFLGAEGSVDPHRIEAACDFMLQLNWRMPARLKELTAAQAQETEPNADDATDGTAETQERQSALSATAAPVEDSSDAVDSEPYSMTLNSPTERERILSLLIGQVNYIEFAYAMVSELKPFLKADRVSLVDIRGDSCRVRSVSDQPVFNKRSNLIRRMAGLAKCCATAGRVTWSDDASLPPQLETAFDSYLDESRSRSVALFPLKFEPTPRNPTDTNRLARIVNAANPSKAPVQAVLVVESMEELLDRPLVSNHLEPLLPSLAAATYSQRKHFDLFLMPAWVHTSNFLELFTGKTKRKAFSILGGISALLLATLIIPADFQIRCEGELRPRGIRPIFATEQATVVRLAVVDGQRVKQGDVLIELEAPGLLVQREEAYAKLVSARERLNSLEWRLSNPRQTRSIEEKELDQLRSDREQVRAEWQSLEQLVNLHDSRLSKVKSITAPISGQVFAWNIQERLVGRPTKPGDRLFSIAEEGSEYVLHLEVPEQRLGYVTESYESSKRSDSSIEVRYVTLSNPADVRLAHLSEVSPIIDAGAQDGVVLPVEAIPNDPSSQLLAEGLRPGTAVIAKIVCGRRSFAFCKLYEFFDWARRGWFRYGY